MGLDLERLLGDAGGHSQVSEDLSYDVMAQTIAAVNPQLTIGRAKNSATEYEYPTHGQTEHAGTLYAEKLVASGRDQDFISARGITYVVTKYVAGQSAQLASTVIKPTAILNKLQSGGKQKPVLGRVSDPVRIAVQNELLELKRKGELLMFHRHREPMTINGVTKKLDPVEWLNHVYKPWISQGKLWLNVLRIVDEKLASNLSTLASSKNIPISTYLHE